MKKRKRSKKLNTLKFMPPLYHLLPDKEFELCKSELLSWVIKQPELLSWLIGYLKDTKYIKYDNLTGKWVGIDYQEPCPHGHIDWDDCPDCCH